VVEGRLCGTTTAEGRQPPVVVDILDSKSPSASPYANAMVRVGWVARGRHKVVVFVWDFATQKQKMMGSSLDV
jgi:hypothetical protein